MRHVRNTTMKVVWFFMGDSHCTREFMCSMYVLWEEHMSQGHHSVPNRVPAPRPYYLGAVLPGKWAQRRRFGLSISDTEDKTKMEILWRDKILRIRQKPGDRTRSKSGSSSSRCWDGESQHAWPGTAAREEGCITWEPNRAWDLPLWQILQFSETWAPWLNPTNPVNWFITLGCIASKCLAAKSP